MMTRTSSSIKSGRSLLLVLSALILVHAAIASAAQGAEESSGESASAAGLERKAEEFANTNKLGSLTLCEKRIIEGAVDGHQGNCRSYDISGFNPEDQDAATMFRPRQASIRSAILVWLLGAPELKRILKDTQVNISGAYVDDLDLSNLTISSSVSFEKSNISKIELTKATLASLSLDHCAVGEMAGSNLRSADQIKLWNVKVFRPISLRNATLGTLNIRKSISTTVWT